MPSYDQYTTKALNRHPDNENFLQPTSFRFVLSRTPEVVYFCQNVSVPTISVNATDILNQFPTTAIADPKMQFEPLSLTFMINEDLGNWKEIFDWMKSFSINSEKYNPDIQTDPRNYQTDGTLVILNSNSRPQASVTFKNMFPTSLGEIEMSASDVGVDPVSATVTFRYDTYDVTVY